jgi:GNAT superfamily N-acetyltransferase
MLAGDMLVQLLKLPAKEPLIEEQRAAGVIIKRANSFEISPVVEFVRSNWNQVWADEVSIAFTRQPVCVFIALRDGDVVGFAAYEATRRNFLGPMGVRESERGKGVGEVLLIAALHAMLEMGYAYAIIGGVGPVEFYAKACGATLIPDSAPGVYTDRIRKK